MELQEEIFSVANAYLSDISTDDTRKGNFGKMAMSSSLGFVLGPAVAGLLGATFLGEIVPVGAAITISAVALWVIWFKLPESKPCVVQPDLKKFKLRKLFATEQNECYDLEEDQKPGIMSVFKLPNISFLVIIYFLTFFGFSFFLCFVSHARLACVGVERL